MQLEKLRQEKQVEIEKNQLKWEIDTKIHKGSAIDVEALIKEYSICNVAKLIYSRGERRFETLFKIF